MVNGNAIDQLHFQGGFFPIRCRGIPKVTLANVFRERSQHCLDLDAHESTTSTVDEAQPSTNPPTTETDEESGAEPTSTPDGEDAASLNDTALQRSRIDSEVSSDSDLDSLESNTPAADSPLLDLSTSIIDFDVQPDQESQTAGSNVIDDVVMLSAKDEEEILAIQRGSKRSKVMVQPSPVPTSNRFAAFEDLHVELEIEEWRLQNIGESTPLRDATKPVVKIPDAIAPNARSYVMPTTVKPSPTETELSYSDPMPLADICDDIHRCLREASKLSSIQHHFQICSAESTFTLHCDNSTRDSHCLEVQAKCKSPTVYNWTTPRRQVQCSPSLGHEGHPTWRSGQGRRLSSPGFE